MNSIRPHLLFVIFCFYFARSYGNLEDFPPCAGRNVTSQPVIDFCLSQNATLKLRCCFTNDIKIILAIDLMHLNLTNVPNISDFANINISVIDLRMNPDLKILPDDFITLKTLSSLYLPPQYDCPGGEQVWQIINKTTDVEGNICEYQKDFCENRTDICTQKESKCQVNGPNNYLCLCQDGYHGYKCLRQNSFPTATFLGPTLGVTAFFSALLYWTQRRHVKK